MVKFLYLTHLTGKPPLLIGRRGPIKLTSALQNGSGTCQEDSALQDELFDVVSGLMVLLYLNFQYDEA